MTDVLIDQEIKEKEKTKNNFIEPSMYKVVFFNDDHTPMEFVISLLIELFKHSDDTARDLTILIHNEGSAVVGTYTYEIAEQKGIEATKISRNNGFPLTIKINKE